MIWVPIQDFDGYSVGDMGEIRNDKFDRLVKPSNKPDGLLKVGLYRDGVQYSRSVALLVAMHFVPHEANFSFNTPINLNGNRNDCSAKNLLWRPRWFALKYHMQFIVDVPEILSKIQDIKSEIVFDNSRDAACKYGLLERDIHLSILNRTYVWPTYQQFRIFEN